MVLLLTPGTIALMIVALLWRRGSYPMLAASFLKGLRVFQVTQQEEIPVVKNPKYTGKVSLKKDSVFYTLEVHQCSNAEIISATAFDSWDILVMGGLALVIVFVAREIGRCFICSNDMTIFFLLLLAIWFAMRSLLVYFTEFLNENYMESQHLDAYFAQSEEK